MSVFRIVRLLMNNTSKIAIGIAVACAGLAFTFYEISSTKTSQIHSYEKTIALLKEQLVDEMRATQDILQLNRQRIEDMNKRNIRLETALQNPELKKSSVQKVAPIFKHALNELRDE